MKSFCRLCHPLTFGRCDVDVDKVMRVNEWENLKQQDLLYSRRFGKTTMFMFWRGMTSRSLISVFSPRVSGLRQAARTGA